MIECPPPPPPNSRALLPIFRTNCPDGSHFAQMGSHFAQSATPNPSFSWPELESGQNELQSGQNGPYLDKMFEKWAKLFKK